MVVDEHVVVDDARSLRMIDGRSGAVVWERRHTTPVDRGAATDGTVQFAGRSSGYGNFIKLAHGGGYGTGYGHLSRILVRNGQQVRKGQQIGAVGSTGLSTGPHLYFEIWLKGQRVDPMDEAVNLPVQLTGHDLAAFRRYVAQIRRLGAIEPTSG